MAKQRNGRVDWKIERKSQALYTWIPQKADFPQNSFLRKYISWNLADRLAEIQPWWNDPLISQGIWKYSIRHCWYWLTLPLHNRWKPTKHKIWLLNSPQFAKVCTFKANRISSCPNPNSAPWLATCVNNYCWEKRFTYLKF